MTHASHCCSAWEHPLQQAPAAALLQQIRVHQATKRAGENPAPVLPAVGWDKSSPPLQPGHSACREEQNKRGPQHLPETDALASLAGACGPGEGQQTDGQVWLCMEHIPLPSPFFELLVTVLAAEAPAFPGSV